MSDFLPGEPDAGTVARFRDGDITALGALFKLYGARVYRLARKMMGNQADAEDATQEIFVRAFEQAHRFKGRSGLFTWLYRLTVRHCLNKIKQRKRSREHECSAFTELERAQPLSTTSPLERLISRERGELLDAILQSLPPHYRTCLVLREVEGLSYAQIAELLGIPMGTVMSRLARARQAMRDRLRAAEDDRLMLGNNADASVVQDFRGAST